MRPLRLVALTLAAVFASTAVAQAAFYNIPEVLKDDLSKVAPRTDVPIRLPRTLNLDFDRNVFGNGSRSAGGYEFDVSATDDCGANACFLAQFSGEEGGEPSFRREVDLAKGITGYYKPLSCGGSCSPPMIEWVQGGVLYSIQAKLNARGRTKQRLLMVRAANSAIRSTPK
jgi:hypothetical protein